MNEQQQSQQKEHSPSNAPDIIAVLKRMQIQLDAMDEKLTGLVQQSKPRAFQAKPFQNKPFSKPYNNFDKTKRSGARNFEGKKEGDAGKSKFYHGSPFGKKKTGGKSPFKKR